MRAPFITGALYLLVAWVAFDGRTKLPEASGSDGVSHIADLAHLVGPGVTLAGVGLCAYLLGTFVVVRDWPEFFTLQHWRLLRYIIIESELAKWRRRRRAGDPRWRIIWGRLATLGRTFPKRLAVWRRRFVGWIAFWRRWRTRSQSYSELAKWRRRESPYDYDRFDPVYLYERADGTGTGMTVRMTHDWAGRLDNWVWRQMDNLHRTFTYRDLKSIDPPDDFLNEVENAWSTFREFLWRRANNEVRYRKDSEVEGAGTLDPENLEEDLSRLLSDAGLRSDQVPPWKPAAKGWRRKPMHTWWDFERNLDEEVHHVVLSEAFLGNLPEERKRLVTKLKSEGSVHYNDFDRAKAEAELRYSAAIPLLLLAGILALTWSPLALALVAAPILMVRQGLAIEVGGFADLYLALQYAGVESPTMKLLYEARDRARPRSDSAGRLDLK